MKKILITAALLSPGILFAQTTATDDAFGTIGASIIVGLLIFFALRFVMLWYWKVNVVVENQEAQLKQQKITNDLLREQNELLGKLVNEKQGTV